MPDYTDPRARDLLTVERAINERFINRVHPMNNVPGHKHDRDTLRANITMLRNMRKLYRNALPGICP